MVHASRYSTGTAATSFRSKLFKTNVLKELLKINEGRTSRNRSHRQWLMMLKGDLSPATGSNTVELSSPVSFWNHPAVWFHTARLRSRPAATK